MVTVYTYKENTGCDVGFQGDRCDQDINSEVVMRRENACIILLIISNLWWHSKWYEIQIIFSVLLLIMLKRWKLFWKALPWLAFFSSFIIIFKCFNEIHLKSKFDFILFLEFESAPNDHSRLCDYHNSYCITQYILSIFFIV